jgi:hypothetical protein
MTTTNKEDGMESTTKITVREIETDEVIGWVWRGGCEHSACQEAEAEGRELHACPREGWLEDYHFETLDQAVAAIERVAHELAAWLAQS